MSIKRLILVGALLVSGAAIVAPTAAAAQAIPSYCFVTGNNQVKNCGFDTGDLTDWTVTSPDNVLVDVVHPHNDQGYKFDMSSNNTPVSVDLSQTLTGLTPDTSYSVSFYGYEIDYLAANSFTVSITGAQTKGRGNTQTLYTDGSADGTLGNNWGPAVLATFRTQKHGSTSHVLKFSFHRVNIGAYSLDDIAVTPSLTLTADPETGSAKGDDVTLHAGFASNAATVDAQGNRGTVTFRDGGRAVPSCTGLAYQPYVTCDTTALRRGKHALTADYTPAGATTPTLYSNPVAYQVTRRS